MDERYGQEVTHSCTICGREGLNRSEMHHIIGRTFINDRATKTQLKYLAKGLEGPVPKNLDKLRKALINELPSNVTELCLKCHRMTDSHLAWFDNWVAKKTGEKPKSRKLTSHEWAVRGKQIAKRRRKTRETCMGLKPNGERCQIGVKPEWPGKYCSHHRDQEKNRDAENFPGLNDEGPLDDEQMYTLEDWHAYGIPFDEYVFADKSDAWKNKWLTRERR